MSLEKPTLKQDLANVHESVRTLKAAEQSLKSLQIAICDRHTPIAIGDVVVGNHDSNQGKKIAVDHLEFEIKWGLARFMAYGNCLRKDGSLGVMRGTWASEAYKVGV